MRHRVSQRAQFYEAGHEDWTKLVWNIDKNMALYGDNNEYGTGSMMTTR